MPLPLITRLIGPWVPSIAPLKVVEPPLGLSVRTDEAPTLLLMTLPPLPGLLSDNEAICWLAPFEVQRAAGGDRHGG